jgi:TolA-binding protein
MAELEDQLRKLRDNLAEIEIENQSYDTLVKAEKQLRDARNESESAAARSVNADLKDHIKRL